MSDQDPGRAYRMHRIWKRRVRANPMGWCGRKLGQARLLWYVLCHLLGWDRYSLPLIGAYCEWHFEKPVKTTVARRTTPSSLPGGDPVA